MERDRAAVANFCSNDVSVLINDQSWTPAPPPTVNIGDVTITEGDAGIRLLPVDLQILFGQTSQVGRQQNIQREGVPLAQAQQGAQIVRRAEQQDASVNQLRQQ